ncbi:Crp/Fnr family transcriptional regulator [Pseudahrensia aquimaris]|uniref:Crp/Fnr family transcriptional regulator n=1 Tax=Pseudahrensia aquimaris TaxID=744461 RepID=A0ABW3FC91_9HYPH
MTVQAKNLLYLIGLFKGLSAQETNMIGDQCEWMRIDKNADVIGQKQDSTDVYFVIEGRVAAKGYSEEGKEVTYAEIPQGNVFGEFSAIDRAPRSATIQAIEESYLARMSADAFRKLIVDFPQIGLNLAELLVQKNRQLTNRMFEFSTMAVSQRICAELLRMMDASEHARTTGEIVPAPSHYEIATRLSTHREAVSKEMASLARRGIIESGRKTIKILDAEKLRGLTHYDFR